MFVRMQNFDIFSIDRYLHRTGRAHVGVGERGVAVVQIVVAHKFVLLLQRTRAKRFGMLNKSAARYGRISAPAN